MVKSLLGDSNSNRKNSLPQAISYQLTGEACSTLYGPVKSRRHGISLGINLGLTEKKNCTWGCVYCQCGYGMRRDFDLNDQRPDAALVLAQLKEELFNYPNVDSVTFAGNSEPTSHPDFRTIARGVMKLKTAMRAKWIVNALSNGSELDRPEVIHGLNLLDEAWIKLDCGLDSEFKRLSRPLPRIGDVKSHVLRIQNLRQPRLQTLLWDHESRSELSNSSQENLDALLECYQQIKPVSIHLMTVSRSPATSGIIPLPRKRLENFSEEILRRGLSVTVFTDEAAEGE